VVSAAQARQKLKDLESVTPKSGPTAT
jgi:hypothetical protein